MKNQSTFPKESSVERQNDDLKAKINPKFDLNTINPETIVNHAEELLKQCIPTLHTDILNQLLDAFKLLDFEILAYPEVEKLKERLAILTEDKESWGSKASTGLPENSKQKERIDIEEQLSKIQLKTRHYLILSIQNVLKVAKINKWDLCKNNDFIFLYNGEYWTDIDKEVFQKFLGEAAEKMGVEWSNAKFYLFREQLFKQFLATAYLPTPEPPNNIVLINLANGTFEISPDKIGIRPFNRGDFMTYQLPFNYDQQAKANMFQKYLDAVLPDVTRQQVLAEYLAYLFIKNSTLKLEKTLLLYGSGANGKSVFFEIVNALLGGDKNVSNYSLQSLTNDNGYFRAMLANKLVNYASEINGKLEASIFKQLVSGEPVEARLPYGKPFTITNYAKLIFNCNELPKDIEHTNAFFRRFLIVPFDVTISENEQDKALSKKIIEHELSGVFNWVLAGLQRLLQQKNFTNSDAVVKQIEQYKKQSDSVLMFLEDTGYKQSNECTQALKELSQEYYSYCKENRYQACSTKTFSERLRKIGLTFERKAQGWIVFVKKELF